ncbi:MAG: thermostable hemolysin [Hyphomicrobiaceae bacterium]
MPSHSAACLSPFESQLAAPALKPALSADNAPGGNAALAAATASPAFFELVEHIGGNRAVAEAFISQRFAASYGSRIEAFMPRLFSVRNRDGDLCGAFGLRSASRNLFLEQYLDAPIEQVISARTGRRIERRLIVEVGHFSGAFAGSARAMIALLTDQLHQEGYEWVVFTGTTGLRNAFCRLGLFPLDIQAATADRIPAEERGAWGSYYEHAPRVLAGNVEAGYRAMRLPDPPRCCAAGAAA